jgi:hypothetical protein
MPESYLNKRITVPDTCRDGAYPDPERNTTTIKQKSLAIKCVNTLSKLISSRHHPCVRNKDIYVSQKVILFNCLQHLDRIHKFVRLGQNMDLNYLVLLLQNANRDLLKLPIPDNG